MPPAIESGQTDFDLKPSELVSAISEGADVPIFIKDLKGRYRLVNRHLASLWNRSVEAVLGRTDAELLPADIACELRRNDQRVVESLVALRIEERLVFGGVERLYLSTKVPLLDDRGQVHGVCGIATDITDMRKAERALRESEERFRFLADAAPVLIWMSGRDKEGVFFNKTWLDFTGRSLDEEIGDKWLDSVHPDDRPALQECSNAFEARRPFQVRFRMRRFDGEYRWLLDTGVPRTGPDGSFEGFIGSCVEISEQMRLEADLRSHAERLAEMHRHKDEFLAMLGHELRNPLAPVRSAIALLQEKSSSLLPELRTAVAIADRQMSQVTRLVDELLDVARIAQGRIELKQGPVHITRVIEAARDAVQPKLTERRLRFDLVEPEVGPVVDGDESRLVQAVANLLHNAAKFTPEGGEVKLEVRQYENVVEIAVSDTGIGIAADELDKLFELFYRKPGAADDGLGLGLALVKKLVESHGGTIRCHSDGPGKGSTFTMALPRLHHEIAQAEPDEAPARARPKHPGRALRVLVVDDNRDAATTLAAVLTAAGHVVELAFDGERALQKLLPASSFDVVLLDIGLPGRDGYAVARAVRARSSEHPVLVALTGYGDASSVERSKASGMDHHLLKPVELRQLRELLNRIAAGADPR